MAQLIIDGYNLIRRSGELSTIEAKNFEQGRLALVQKLSAYKELTGHKITVVFDASRTENSSVEEDRISGIKILYSEGGQTADEVIINIANKIRDQAIVVSSDNEIIRAAKTAGCAHLGAGEFEKKLDKALMYAGSSDPERDKGYKKSIHKRWITKKKGPSKRLPKAKRKAMTKLKNL